MYNSLFSIFCNDLMFFRLTGKEFHLTTPERLSKFSYLCVEFPEGNLRQLASGDCNL